MAGINLIFIYKANFYQNDTPSFYQVLMCLTTGLASIPAVLFAWVPSAKEEIQIMNDGTDITTANSTRVTYATSPSIASATNNTLSETLGYEEVNPDQLVRTFWYYMAVRVSFGILQSLGYTLFEAAVMANMQHNGINFGYQRIWGTLAVVLTSVIGGHIIEATGGYNTIFYVAGAFQFLSGILMMGVTVDFKPPATTLTENILKQFINAEIVMFFAAMLVAGETYWDMPSILVFKIKDYQSLHLDHKALTLPPDHSRRHRSQTFHMGTDEILVFDDQWPQLCGIFRDCGQCSLKILPFSTVYSFNFNFH
ncbi:hypothetical protein SK128_019756, partial [Halocaridina rubra]